MDLTDVAEYVQGTTRYTGTEARFDAALHPAVWLNLGLDYVNAELTETRHPAAANSAIARSRRT